MMMKMLVLVIWVTLGVVPDARSFGTAMQQDTLLNRGERPDRIDEIRQRMQQIRQGVPSGFQVVTRESDVADTVDIRREQQTEQMIARLEELILQLEQQQAAQLGVARPDVIREIVRDTVVIRDTVVVVVRDTVFIERDIPVPPEILTVEIELMDKGIFRTSSVLFEFDQARILPASHAILDEIARILRERVDLRIEVQGHTDSFGPRAYNLALSQSRAEAVRAYLLGNNPGIDAGRILARGFGPDQPIAENTSTTGRALNRRVDFIVLD